MGGPNRGAATTAQNADAAAGRPSMKAMIGGPDDDVFLTVG